MKISCEQLIDAGNNQKYDAGYRIVYFEDNDKYSIGAYSKTVEGFMIGFAECDPIITEDDIPPFVSTDDILNRCLELYDDITEVAIYKTDGTCVSKKSKENLMKK